METNQQPREKAVHDEDGTLQVHHAWHTMQGEGPFAGTPAVFVRLTGCNLQCAFCDTEYTSQRYMLAPSVCVEVVRGIRPSGLVVLTGGEPFRQNITPFCDLLIAEGYTVQVETNGTFPVSKYLPDAVNIVCSPKTPVLHIDRVDAWKYVLDANHVDEYDGLPTKTLMSSRPARPNRSAQVYVQPMDEQDEAANKRNTDAAVASCMKYGYRFCAQVHKIIGLE